MSFWTFRLRPSALFSRGVLLTSLVVSTSSVDQLAAQEAAQEAATEADLKTEAAAAQKTDISNLIEWLLDDSRQLDGVPFPDVIRATTGKEILPMKDQADPVCAAITKALSSAMDATLVTLNKEDSPVLQQRRINEASKYFEEEMLRRLDALDDFSCGYPTLVDGRVQRSGYPDLKLVHKPSGRVAYIDPKLFEDKSMRSSLRTFYFEPKTRTNKVLENAHHILVGISHDGNSGKWKFTSWHAVDLAEFKVRLKAEFQAGNKDLYDSDLIFSESAPAKSPDAAPEPSIK